MTGLLIKLVVCPTVVYLSGFIFGEVNFTTILAPIFIGLILAIAAHTMEVFILRPGTLWSNTIIDFAAATVLVFLLSMVLPGANVTLLGAIYTALLLMFTEYAQHLWLIWKGKTNKSNR